MPASYEIYPELNLKYVTIKGRTDLKELKQLLMEYLVDPNFDPSHRQIIDLCEMDEAIAGFWEMFSLKKLYEKAYRGFPDPITVKIVATSPFSRRLAWMFTRVMKSKKTMDVVVFSEVGDALSAMAIDFDRFRSETLRILRGNVVELSSYVNKQDA